MGHNGGEESDGLGNSYPVLWKADLTRVDEPWIKQCCFIPRTVNLRFDDAQKGAMVNYVQI